MKFNSQIQKVYFFLNRNKYQLLIVLIASLLFYINYKPGTYLTGWDNLQTELYPWISIKRAFFAVWQEYQSFGLVSGLAHAADLVRSVFIWFLSLFLSQNIIRYFFHSLMVLIGGLGVFSLLNFTAFNKKRIFSFIGSVFYMLNLGTVQIFYVPYEAFSIFFAALPWQIWIFLKLLENKNKTNLLLFLAVNFLATPQAYIQTLFVVYILILGSITIGMTIETKSLLPIKKAFLSFILIFIINSFWIFPQLYFLKSEGKVVKESKINQLATDSLYFENREKGTLQNLIKMEGFYYELYRSNQKALFLEWKDHFSKISVKIAQYFIVFLVFLGLFSKRKYHFSFVAALILLLLGLLNADPPFSWINTFLRQNDFIDRIFRTPFTKFIVPYSIVASYFIASGANLIYQNFSKVEVLASKLSRNNLGFIIVLVIFYYSFPSFNGYFFSPSMKISIPKDYFELFQYLKSEDENKRIALLPDHTFWGWFYHRWGYDGSGFLWYGIEQPIVSRTFDVWSSASEAYYWEIKAATEAEDLETFEKILEKYNIDYLILDKSLLPISATFKGLQYDRLEAMLASSDKITLGKRWGDVSLYLIHRDKVVNNFISASTFLPNIGPEIKITNKDIAYLENSDYITDKRFPYHVYYPFLDLNTQKNDKNRTWRISENAEKFLVSNQLDFNVKDYEVASISAEIPLRDVDNTPIFEIDNNKISVEIPRQLARKFNIDEVTTSVCGFTRGESLSNILGNSVIITSSKGESLCFGFEDLFLEQRYGYLVKVKSDNIEGRNLFFYILDITKKQGYLETRLTNGTEYYLISPKFQYGLGYSFNFQNNSYKNLVSKNRLSDLEIYSFPVDYIKNIHLIKKGYSAITPRFLDSVEAKKINYYKYVIKEQDLSKANVVILNQSFSRGWNAYSIDSGWSKTFPYLFGKRLKDHVLVNNWANGWVVNDDVVEKNVVFVFLPQYLEYIGFVVLILTFSWVFFWKKNE